MLRATFDIKPAAVNRDEWRNSLLLMEVGEKLFSYVVYNKNKQQALAYRQYNLEYMPGKTPMEVLQEILLGDDLLQQLYREAYVIYHYADSSLLPEKFFHIDLNKPATELLYGNAQKGLLLNEKVSGWELYTIYRIPREVHALFQQKFSAGKYWHYYTLLLTGTDKNVKKRPAAIKVVVAADRFIAAVFSNNEVQLLQTYFYQTPDDVSYHLLAICGQFGMDQQEVVLYVSGLIDEQSNLYQEMLKYFLHVKWEVVPTHIRVEEAFTAFPPHYFSPLLNMALCV